MGETVCAQMEYSDKNDLARNSMNFSFSFQKLLKSAQMLLKTLAKAFFALKLHLIVSSGLNTNNFLKNRYF